MSELKVRKDIGVKPSIHALLQGNVAEKRASAWFQGGAVLSFASV